MTGVVLLCAEEDDLELVSWVHNARKHGITPEVVIGVERDDEPLIEALADADSRLFVVLRSENLDVSRIRELKAVFARHRRQGQELLALRLQPEEAEDAIVKIAAKIGRDLRPRTGPFPAVSLSERSGVMIPPSERSGATPRPVFNEATPVPLGTEPTGVFSAVDDDDVEPPTIAWAPAAPPVAEALDWARRATELEITEPQARIDPAPIIAAANERARAAKVRPASVAVLGTITAIVMLGAVVGGVLWMSATEWTSPIDSVPRSTVVAPVSGAPVVDADAPSEARIPTMPRSGADEPETPTKRPRSKPRAHESSNDHESDGPFDTIEPATPTSAAPIEPGPSPVAEAAPAEPKADAAPTETASASTSAAADSPGRRTDSRTPANEPSGAVAVKRPPA